MRIGKKLRLAVVALGLTAVAAISVSASDFTGRTLNQGRVVAPAVLTASSGPVATTVQFRRPLGYYDRWGHFHYYSWVYSGRYRDDFRFRRGDSDDYRYRRDWDDHHRRDWDDRFRHNEPFRR